MWQWPPLGLGVTLPKMSEDLISDGRLDIKFEEGPWRESGPAWLSSTIVDLLHPRRIRARPTATSASLVLWQSANVRDSNFQSKTLEKRLPVLITVTEDGLFFADRKGGHACLMCL